MKPTGILYDINKQLLHEAAGVGHTNVGVSGFTNSWSLISFPGSNNGTNLEEGELFIEQYQSDYPAAAAHIFSEDENVYNQIVKKYGDKEAIKAYDEQRVFPKSGDRITVTEGLRKGSSGKIQHIITNYDYSLTYVVDLDGSSGDPIELLEGFEGEDGTEYSLSSKLPIELAPELKDTRKHMEYISKAYPYLSIINAIKVAQTLKKENIYISINAPEYARISNQKKATKLYDTIPRQIGGEESDIQGEPAWKIKASNETIERLKALIQQETGKKDYDFSLTPKQNQEKKDEEFNKKKEKRNQWNASPEKVDKLNQIHQRVTELVPDIDMPSFQTPQQALRFLNQEVSGKAINKKKFKKLFGPINRDLGMLSRAHKRKQRLIKLAIINRRMKFQ